VGAFVCWTAIASHMPHLPGCTFLAILVCFCLLGLPSQPHILHTYFTIPCMPLQPWFFLSYCCFGLHTYTFLFHHTCMHAYYTHTHHGLYLSLVHWFYTPPPHTCLYCWFFSSSFPLSGSPHTIWILPHIQPFSSYTVLLPPSCYSSLHHTTIVVPCTPGSTTCHTCPHITTDLAVAPPHTGLCTHFLPTIWFCCIFTNSPHGSHRLHLVYTTTACPLPCTYTAFSFWFWLHAGSLSTAPAFTFYFYIWFVLTHSIHSHALPTHTCIPWFFLFLDCISHWFFPFPHTQFTTFNLSFYTHTLPCCLYTAYILHFPSHTYTTRSQDSVHICVHTPHSILLYMSHTYCTHHTPAVHFSHTPFYMGSTLPWFFTGLWFISYSSYMEPPFHTFLFIGSHSPLLDFRTHTTTHILPLHTHRFFALYTHSSTGLPPILHTPLHTHLSIHPHTTHTTCPTQLVLITTFIHTQFLHIWCHTDLWFTSTHFTTTATLPYHTPCLVCTPFLLHTFYIHTHATLHTQFCIHTTHLHCLWVPSVPHRIWQVWTLHTTHVSQDTLPFLPPPHSTPDTLPPLCRLPYPLYHLHCTCTVSPRLFTHHLHAILVDLCRFVHFATDCTTHAHVHHTFTALHHTYMHTTHMHFTSHTTHTHTCYMHYVLCTHIFTIHYCHTVLHTFHTFCTHYHCNSPFYTWDCTHTLPLLYTARSIFSCVYTYTPHTL